jgi:3-hydroxyacyl-[acyl-carrier-protein] dehydratase/UDP-3-O-[3-hydroxymyristoyl] N-acetylglucosamine deacetylase/3-hydroxyacyl-[acyl-carrier-protein] dehydratase
MPKPVWTLEEILDFLPHRFPFLLVDRVLELEKGKSIVAVKNVTCNEQFFQGHFPDLKIMPGVLILEAIAQAGGIILFHALPEPKKKMVVLSKIDKAKFKRMVIPGDQLRLEVQLVKLKGRICHIRGRAVVDGEVATEAEIFATLLDIEEMNARV